MEQIKRIPRRGGREVTTVQGLTNRESLQASHAIVSSSSFLANLSFQSDVHRSLALSFTRFLSSRRFR